MSIALLAVLGVLWLLAFRVRRSAARGLTAANKGGSVDAKHFSCVDAACARGPAKERCGAAVRRTRFVCFLTEASDGTRGLVPLRKLAVRPGFFWLVL